MSQKVNVIAYAEVSLEGHHGEVEFEREKEYDMEFIPVGKGDRLEIDGMQCEVICVWYDVEKRLQVIEVDLCCGTEEKYEVLDEVFTRLGFLRTDLDYFRSGDSQKY
ncbi:hypothetical protein VN12_04325 [Pirellula sp. SH-Sr6A]|nr:hypothetical protein VN12_04325 [Pirellula sp. SH-Sr6A]